ALGGDIHFYALKGDLQFERPHWFYRRTLANQTTRASKLSAYGDELITGVKPLVAKASSYFQYLTSV
ncbi:MAG: hypothetical protein WBG55_12370, partial [Pseudoalteromonas rhizosphaerae]|uniref:hypothetical protein n=1 Tax=Pseudoalteromonas rhizosphaerae TaxID=2518973 RepID=UPI003C755F53